MAPKDASRSQCRHDTLLQPLVATCHEVRIHLFATLSQIVEPLCLLRILLDRRSYGGSVNPSAVNVRGGPGSRGGVPAGRAHGPPLAEDLPGREPGTDHTQLRFNIHLPSQQDVHLTLRKIALFAIAKDRLSRAEKGILHVFAKHSHELHRQLHCHGQLEDTIFQPALQLGLLASLAQRLQQLAVFWVVLENSPEVGAGQRSKDAQVRGIDGAVVCLGDPQGFSLAEDLPRHEVPSALAFINVGRPRHQNVHDPVCFALGNDLGEGLHHHRLQALLEILNSGIRQESHEPGCTHHFRRSQAGTVQLHRGFVRHGVPNTPEDHILILREVGHHLVPNRQGHELEIAGHPEIQPQAGRAAGPRNAQQDLLVEGVPAAKHLHFSILLVDQRCLTLHH
mmetsp:Transcript_20935/g.49707  ORF Transcript_20935/g.49707 Transcript_20935/m.49707 type:complete len:394 (-) Transcript_20935:1571-2752(-)